MTYHITRKFVFSLHIALAAVLGVVFATGGGAVPARAVGNHDVVILVVDDFSGADLSTLAENDYAPNESCALSVEGQAFAVRGVSAVPISQPHGELVYAELEELIDDADASNVISLVKVNIQGMPTAEAADRIDAAMSSHHADVYVANMSFAIIPCEYLQAFADFGSQLLDARDAKDLNRYRNLFERTVVFYNNTVYPAMSKRAQQQTNLDPIQALLVDHENNLIPVAAAGNFGLDFPFWPAAWGQVISVSASEGRGYYASDVWDKKKDTPLLMKEPGQSGKQNRISNYGEVMMPGVYNSEDGSVVGTSFAAPRLSVAMALYATQVGTNVCRKSNHTPALAYGDWDNLTLDKAVHDYCPAMESSLP